MLVLFDIDATLITTSRTGILAMGEAGRELFGPRFSEHTVDYAGRLDPLIITDLLTAHDRPVTPEAMGEFRAAYGRRLTGLVARPGVARPLPGVMELVDALRRRSEVTLGLLTGNFPETGAIKLRAAGIEPDWFPVQAWGCDSPHEPPARDHLPPVAIERDALRRGERLAPERVTIIGDTPHDVRCALVNGCRALGVATGGFDVTRLAEAGAHRAVADLSRTPEILSWLLSSAPARA